MSAEKIQNHEKDNLAALIPHKVGEKSSDRVDINILLARVIKQKKEENKTNLVFIALFAAIISTLLIILSF